jgi:general secretion pathway protein N
MIVFASSVIVHLPAKFVVDNLPKIRGLSISGVDGTLWQGSAKQVIWQKYKLGEVNWSFEPSKLLAAKAQLNVRFGRNSELGLTGRGLIGYSLSGPYAENLIASMPAKKVMSMASIAAPIVVDGQLDLVVKSYQYASPWCENAQANLVWNNSQVSSPFGNLILGTIITDVNCTDNQLLATGNQRNNQVSSEFTASIGANMIYDVDAWFKPGAEFPNGLAKQLKWLGEPNNQGHYPLVYSGKL